MPLDVASKEGRCAVKVANVSNFWMPEIGKSEIKILDPNITACREKRDLMRQYRETGATLDFTQGIDIRMVDDDDIADLNSMRLKDVHFAWDNPKEKLERKFEYYAKKAKKNKHGRYGTVYCLTNYNSTMQENLYRIYTLRELGFDPYVMVYNKQHAPREVKDLQRWCNNRIIFGSVKNFEDYRRKNGSGSK